MSCGIYVFREITRVEGEGVWLQGTALGCSGVEVVLEGEAASEVGFNDGYWRARFADRDLVCNGTEELTVQVHCLPSGNCAGSPYTDKLTFNVRCTAIVCPPKSQEGIEVEYCYNGTNETRFAVTYEPALPSDTFAIFRVSNGTDVWATTPVQALDGRFEASLILSPGTHVVAFEILGRIGACDTRRIDVPGCQCVQNVTLELRDASDALVASVDGTTSGAAFPCVDPARGPFSVRARVTPGGADRIYYWYVNGASDPLPSMNRNRLDDVALTAYQAFSARVVVRQPGCNDASVELRAEGCPVPPPPCPTVFRIEVREGGESGNTVFAIVSGDADAAATPPSYLSGDEAVPCLTPGNYSIAVVEPVATGLRYAWTGTDAQPIAGAESPVLPYEILADGSSDGTVGVLIFGAEGVCLSPDIPMRSCECPKELTVRVFDISDAANPREVGKDECLTPGPYEARAEGVDAADSSFEWSLGGKRTGVDGSVHPIDVKSVLRCGVRKADVDLVVTARPRTNPKVCAPSASYAGQVCPQYVFCIECWLLRMLLVAGIGLFTLALIFAFCPGVCDVFWLRWIAKVAQDMGEYRVMSVLWGIWGGILTVSFTITRVVIVLAGLALIPFLLLLKFYIDRCKPTWCFDWFPLIWQAMLIAGLLCLFYASCPTCIPILDGTGLIMFLPGGLLTIGGLILWAIWAFGKCNIPWCRALFELGSVGLIPKVFANGIILLILAPCTWSHGAWVLLVFDFVFFLIMLAAAICFASDKRYNFVSRN